tara:strand:+ start:1718 stop:1834 length:117 start_codon:yes stop_codon:yes gene_type:complete
MSDKGSAEETAKLIWQSWVTDSTDQEECIYEEGQGKED